MKICSQLVSMQDEGKFYIVHADQADIKIYFLTDEIVRIRASFDKEFAEESYALVTTAWEDRLDFLFEGERKKVEPIIPQVVETEDKITMTTQAIRLEIQKNPICFKVYDKQGELLYSDIEGNPFVLDSNNRVTHYSGIGYDDCFYGFGEKPGEINKAQHYMRLSAKDAMGYDPVDIDSLYKHIPFYIKLKRDTKKAVGLYYHNTYECAFNMGREKSNYWPYYSYFQADGGDIDLFLIAGNKISRVIENYTTLTGKSAMLPKRALGYQGSSMYYPELEKDCDEAIEGFIDTVIAEDIPIDGFHLSSGYTTYDNKRCVFTWNKDRFKSPETYFANMNQKGAQNVPNVKPGILLMHPLFEEMDQQGVFVKNEEETQYAIGKWWGGDGAFWDFTKPEARTAWKGYLTEHVISKGTNSIWNDNCEYDSLMNKDSVCDFDGKKGTIGQLKPIMSNLMCKLANEAVKEYDHQARPYVVCRSGYAGIQRYAQTWCGDNSTSWKSLKYNIATILGMGLSGVANQGSDIGGFYGPAPDAELFVRWVQQGIFQPRFSIHSTNIDNTVTEPWMYSGHTQYIREAIKLRYRMTPYLYSYMYEANQSGAPIMRPTFYEFQDDEKCFDESVNYMFGKWLLVANVVEPGEKTRKVYLPAGTKWYDFDTYACYEGGQTIEVPVDIASIPRFIREGAIIPMAQNQLMNMERDQVTDLHLIVSPKEEESFLLYNDDGVSNHYENGEYLKTTIGVTGGEKVQISFDYEGNFEDTVENIVLDVISKDKGPFWVSLEGEELVHFFNRSQFEKAEKGWYYSQTKKAVLVKYKNPKQNHKVIVSFEHFDMIGM